MRAKRSKKYRKIMSAYQMAFGFREPYQVLLDSNFLRACHSFHMPLQKYLENTLHGECRLFVTKCTLAKIMADWEKQQQRQQKRQEKDGDNAKRQWPRRTRPDFLPPPTEVPLRHCKHKDDAGEDVGEVGETRCLLDLLAGQPHGNEVAKNKQHYILATAEDVDSEHKDRNKTTPKKRSVDVRDRARSIPGVPIVYVKRSVMILEELSGSSESSRRRGEKDKFSEGLIGLGDRKRKRGEDDSGDDTGDDDENAGPKVRGVVKRAKGPNPLSVRKKKEKPTNPQTGGGDQADNPQQPEAKPKRRKRKHGGAKNAGGDGNANDGEAAGNDQVTATVPMEA